MKNISLAFLLCVFMGCESQNAEEAAACKFPGAEALTSNVTTTQGLYGLVSFTEGNCMPGSSGSCRTCPVKRIIRFYDYTLSRDATPAGMGGFYSSFNTRLVAQAESNLTGFYEVTLPPGTYTMVVVEDGKLYANRGDGQGGINPVTVTTGVGQKDFQINYKAAY